jgi:hypothetical protein
MDKPEYSSLPKGFWDKVKPNSNGCWLWAAGRSGGGYGHYKMKGGVQSDTHRLTAPDAKGAIPEGLYVLHTCDVKLCVNPDHLYYGTQKQNIADMYARGREKKGNAGLFGENHGCSILTDARVIEIRKKYDTGAYTQLQLACEYGVSRTTVGQVVRREQWTHV